jgi:lipoteichoic acid synthase
MVKMIKSDSLFICFLLSLFYMDIVFRFLTVDHPFSFYLVLSWVFLLATGFAFYFISSFVHGTVRFLFSIFCLICISLLYTSQYINLKMARTFYSIYSAGNGAQLMDFWRDIANQILKNTGWILLFFLPVFLLSFAGKKVLTFEKIDIYNRISLLICLALSYATAIGIVFMSGKEQHTPYDLYFKNSYPLLSAERLGLITTMRLDLQRMISGWSPSLDPPEISASLQQDIPSTANPSNQTTKESDLDDYDEGKKIEFNTLPIDFGRLITEEPDQTIKDMHKYFANVPPAEKNEYTGKYKGYNLIFITAESFAPYAIDKELTPTLYKMVHEGFQFTNFYNPIWGVSTSDGEYVACTGLIPKSGIWSFRESGSNSMPFAMGNQLKKLNYKTSAFHNHTFSYYRRDISHPNLGYEYKGLGNGLDIKKTWPESDLEMMEKTIPEYIQKQPFHTYYMTVSGHLRYSFTGNYIASKNKKYVQDLPYLEQGKAYLATQIELDRAMEYLLTQLENAGIADKTLIVLSPDHFPYGLEDATIDELTGHQVEKSFELYKSSLIIYTKGMKPEKVDKPSSSLDIIPTISNLLGLGYDSRLLMGSDIFSNSEPLVIFINKSFITDKGSYNSVTKEFLVNDGRQVDENYIKNISDIVQAKFYYSAKILETDYYKKVLGD